VLNVVLPHVDIFMPNETELLGLAGGGDIDGAARQLASETGAMIVAKLGADGGLIASADEVLRARAPEVNPVDTTGAGDSFNAVYLWAVHGGMEPSQALELAVKTASELISSESAVRAEILSALTDRNYR